MHNPTKPCLTPNHIAAFMLYFIGGALIGGGYETTGASWTRMKEVHNITAPEDTAYIAVPMALGAGLFLAAILLTDCKQVGGLLSAAHNHSEIPKAWTGMWAPILSASAGGILGGVAVTTVALTEMGNTTTASSLGPKARTAIHVLSWITGCAYLTGAIACYRHWTRKNPARQNTQPAARALLNGARTRGYTCDTEMHTSASSHRSGRSSPV